MNRIGATLLGGLIGAGAALLLAPGPGRETRRRLRNRADDLRSDAQDRLAESRMRATELIRSTQERAQEVIERGKREVPEEGQKWADASLERERDEIP